MWAPHPAVLVQAWDALLQIQLPNNVPVKKADKGPACTPNGKSRWGSWIQPGTALMTATILGMNHCIKKCLILSHSFSPFKINKYFNGILF